MGHACSACVIWELSRGLASLLKTIVVGVTLQELLDAPHHAHYQIVPRPIPDVHICRQHPVRLIDELNLHSRGLYIIEAALISKETVFLRLSQSEHQHAINGIVRLIRRQYGWELCPFDGEPSVARQSGRRHILDDTVDVGDVRDAGYDFGKHERAVEEAWT